MTRATAVHRRLRSTNLRKAIAAKAQVSEHKVRQVETVAKHRPELLPKVESGAVKLKDAVKIITVHSEPERSPANTEKDKAAARESRRITGAFSALTGFLYGFECDNWATLDPNELRGLMRPDQLEVLRSCHQWMEGILHAEKAQAAEQH
jgi:hypothetical protein